MNTVTLLLVLHLLLPISIHASIVWIGAVTSTSFKIHADIPANATRVILSKSETFREALQSKDAADLSSKIGTDDTYKTLRQFTFSELEPATLYYVGTVAGNINTLTGSVRTFPEEQTPEDVTIAVSSCQKGASKTRVFAEIRKWHDDLSDNSNFFMLHMGDMAYSDISTNNISLYEASLRQVLEQRQVKSVFSVMPVSYMYDDHDYGVNNAGFSSESRLSALQNYRNMVPSHDLPSTEASFHAFTVGRVRVIMSDLRALDGKDDGSTMGISQRQWFLSELQDAGKYDVVVWMTSKPWIGRTDDTKDSWAGSDKERKLISEKMADFNVNNLIAVAGDAHMLAADDGRNTDYSERGAGFPVFQAAPISNFGSSKGGPYSEGCHGYFWYKNEHYGILRITKLGTADGPCVQFGGYTKANRKRPIIAFQRCGKLGGVTGKGGQDSKCDLEALPFWITFLVVSGAIVAVILSVFFLVRCLRASRQKQKDSEFTERMDSSELERREQLREETEAIEMQKANETWERMIPQEEESAIR